MRMIFDAIKNLFGRRFTRNYPKTRPPLPEGLRAKVMHDREKCIYCGMCARYCPSDAIKVDMKKREWRYDWGKCLFCAQCEEVCRDIVKKDAIKLTQEFELAGKDRKRFIFSDKGKSLKPEVTKNPGPSS